MGIGWIFVADKAYVQGSTLELVIIQEHYGQEGVEWYSTYVVEYCDEETLAFVCARFVSDIYARCH